MSDVGQQRPQTDISSHQIKWDSLSAGSSANQSAPSSLHAADINRRNPEEVPIQLLLFAFSHDDDDDDEEVRCVDLQPGSSDSSSGSENPFIPLVLKCCICFHGIFTGFFLYL